MAEEIKKDGEKVIEVVLESEVKKSYLEYAMSVIVGRALPDVRDGLKPVHRRILYAMRELGNLPNRPFKKSAKIVGQVLGNYHPHGEAAIYDSLVRLAQDFSMRYPLVEGHGNFGSIDGDPPAAMRYSEVRLAKISLELLDELDQKTVPFMPNFDASLEEPEYLPAKIPNLLLNGSSGIAVGMATNIPPHNLSEVIDALLLTIDKPEASIQEIMQFLKGPDFPTGGRIIGIEGIQSYFETGRGSVKLQGKGHIEEAKNKTIYVIDELPYIVNKSELLKTIAELAKENKIQGVSDLRDESDREGIRVVIELKKGINPFIFENQLYKLTQYETNFGVIMLALVNKIPKELNIKELLNLFIEHRKDIITKRTNFELSKSRARRHILSGLKIGISNIDKVLELIKSSENSTIAKVKLEEAFELTPEQSSAIIEMSLGRLTSLEQQKIDNEMDNLNKYINSLEDIIKNDTNLLSEIKNELLAIKDKYGDKRRTEIIYDRSSDYSTDDLIHDDPVIVLFTRDGYIKRMKEETYKTQGRGGKGVIGITKREDDEIQDIFSVTNHKTLLFFTEKGKVFSLKVHNIPEAERRSKGTPISYLLQLEPDDSVSTALAISDFKEDKSLLMVTERGIIKKVALNNFENIRRNGIIAIRLKNGDKLKKVRIIKDNDTVIIVSKNGYAVRFTENLRKMGRASYGVRGIRLSKDDSVVGMEIEEEDHMLLCLTEKGYGKLSNFKLFRKTKRGTKGVRAIKISSKTGPVAACRSLRGDTKLIITTAAGNVIQINTKQIPKLSRNSMGVRLIRIGSNDRVIAVARESLD
ncbi:MAG TPA: DNA gyrase subunit A [Caldisericia bacterium]|nr:DNA gyrase subunit A [Caldisericia bacterium]HPO28556.1 DNA gyrase subunit A [Caldisericia bacterium]HXK70329.1 DNA gyrase subunit A [Caldisericia bacterium]